ncbi:hypothetical protein H5410_025548 [Solanum commersonii]|uniref:Uncharacterized protein n=1 Tax=Solanum commersonii TaxID=4109 RepID=A0A9J5YW71_SOLCO|nr:hypothetical protein H5410_025548 [Solanum commersonii]
MTEAFKRLNAKVEALLQENTKLMEQIKSLKGKDSIQKINIALRTSKRVFHLSKNGWQDTSPDQTRAVKTHQTRLWVSHFAKSEGEGSSSSSYPDHLFNESGPNTSPRNTNNNITRSNSSGEEDYREHSYYQDAQNPNADDDSGMSFDSEALHNLDT